MAGAIELMDQLIAAPPSEAQLHILERHKASRAHLPRHRPTMPTFDWRPRKALTELRPRHLHMIEEYGFRREYDRDALGEYFLAIGIGCSGHCGDRRPVKCGPIIPQRADGIELAGSQQNAARRIYGRASREIILVKPGADVQQQHLDRRLPLRQG
jgi:hypothetical protein